MTKALRHAITATAFCARMPSTTVFSSFGGLDQFSSLTGLLSVIMKRASAAELRIYGSLAKGARLWDFGSTECRLTCGKGCKSMLDSLVRTSWLRVGIVARPVYTLTAASSLWTLPDLKCDFWMSAKKGRHLGASQCPDVVIEGVDVGVDGKHSLFAILDPME